MQTRGSAGNIREVQNTNRPETGGTLVEGVIGLVLIVAAGIGMALFLANIGLSVYYKEKLGFVANQTAAYAASIDGEGVQEKAKQYAEALLRGTGMNPWDLKCDVSSVSLPDGQVGTQVKLTNTFSLIQSGVTYLPGIVRLSDQAVASAATGALGKLIGYWRVQSATGGGGSIPAVNAAAGLVPLLQPPSPSGMLGDARGVININEPTINGKPVFVDRSPALPSEPALKLQQSGAYD